MRYAKETTYMYVKKRLVIIRINNVFPVDAFSSNAVNIIY